MCYSYNTFTRWKKYLKCECHQLHYYTDFGIPLKVINKYTTVMLLLTVCFFIHLWFITLLFCIFFFTKETMEWKINVNLTEFFKKKTKTNTSPENVSVRTKIFSFGIEDDDAKIFPCEIILFKGAIENIFVNNKCQIEIFLWHVY